MKLIVLSQDQRLAARLATFLLLCLLLHSMCLGAATSDVGHSRLARRILADAGVRGGLIVHVGCGDGQLTAALRLSDSFLVHGLDTDPQNVAQARNNVCSRGLYGKVSIEPFAGDRLPYADNLVNLLVTDELGAAPMEEVLRVLAPLGVAMISADGRQWSKIVKPWPDEIDEWTHYLHDATNNAVAHDTVVGPPRRLQWTDGPNWARHHDHVASVSAMVSSRGRLFSIIDEGPTASILLPPKWSLVARDAFNGGLLWKRPLPDWIEHFWPLKSGPAQLPRRLVAVGDRVFVTLGLEAPLSMLDAATGNTLRTYPDSKNTEEVVLSAGLLFLVVRDDSNARQRYRVESTSCAEEKARVAAQWSWDEKQRWLLAVEPESGVVRWRTSRPVSPLTLAADRQRVYFYDGERIVGLNRADGERLWTSAPVPRRGPIVVNYAPNLVVSDDVVVIATGSRSMTALAADTGKTLWSAPHPRSGYCSPEDLFVVQGAVWTGNIRNTAASTGIFTQRDLHSGRVLNEYPPDDQIYHFPHHRCYRAKATERYILASRTGIEFIDTRSGHWTDHHWVRGGCLYGLMPCNGLVYTPPHYCACFVRSKLSGFCALAGKSAVESSKVGAGSPPAAGRLEHGPAAADIDDPQSAIANPLDWPTYRHDAARSGVASSTVPAKLQVAWRTGLHGRITAPTVAGATVFVAEIDAHTVHALDVRDGSPRWRFTAGGRVDSPPTIHRGRVLFGSADGWVYCLRAADGQLAWRFRAAPVERRIMASGQLESPWPVHGSVLVKNDTLHCIAGRSMFLDGGLRLLRLDPATGRKLGEVVRNEVDPATGEHLQYHVNQARNMKIPVALPDILSANESGVFMRSERFDFGETNSAGRGQPEAKPRAAQPLINCPAGYLDDSWMNRLGWSCGRSPPSRILVFDAALAYGYGFSRQYGTLSPHEHHLYAARIRPAGRPKDDGKPGPSLLWSQARPPLLARAMVLADSTLFVAGPPDLGMTAEEADYRNYHDSDCQAALSEQAAAWDGQRGGLLWAVSKTDGRRLAEFKLDSPPVWDGMSAARTRLFLSTVDGHVVCFGAGA